MITELRRGVEILPVSTDGYTNPDMNMYYSGTYLLYQTEEGFLPCVVNAVEDFVFHITTKTDRMEVSADKLFRFLLPSGFYQSGNALVYLSLKLGKSYKKSITNGGMRVNKPFSPREIRPFDGLTMVLSASEEPQVISRRIALHDGKVIMFPSLKSVGNFKSGLVTTPFDKLSERINQNRGDLQCRLEQ